MVWFFDRAEEVARLQTTFDDDTREYVLVIEAPNELVRTDRFPTEQAFRGRLVEVQHQLRTNGWVQRGGVEMLHDGWRGPTTRRH